MLSWWETKNIKLKSSQYALFIINLSKLSMYIKKGGTSTST